MAEILRHMAKADFAELAAAAGIGSGHAHYRALREFEARTLIEQTYPASRVPPRPAMWALSWLPVDDTKYSSVRRTAPLPFSHGSLQHGE